MCRRDTWAIYPNHRRTFSYGFMSMWRTLTMKWGRCIAIARCSLQVETSRSQVGGCFFPKRIPAELVFDLVYNPLETELIRRARAAHKQTISGLEMFVEQACAQFEIWTRDQAPRTAMRNAVLKQLGAKT